MKLRIVVDPMRDLDITSNTPPNVQLRLLLLEKGFKFKNSNMLSFICESIEPVPEGVFTRENDLLTRNIIFTQTTESKELVRPIWPGSLP